MSIPRISPANLATIEKQRTQQTTNNVVQKTEAKDNKKKIMLALAGLAVAGIAAIGIGVITKNHKKTAQVGQEILNGVSGANNTGNISEVTQNLSAKLSDIKFNAGIATKNGENYTGVIEDTLKNGKKIRLEYENGVIKKSLIDDKISKIYSSDTIQFNNMPSTSREVIKTNGDERIVTRIIKNENGETVRVARLTKEDGWTYLDFKDKKVIAKTINASDNFTSEIYDENGEVIKTIKYNKLKPHTHQIITKQDDGTERIVIASIHPNSSQLNDGSVANIIYNPPEEILSGVKNGKPKTHFYTGETGKENSYNLQFEDGTSIYFLDPYCKELKPFEEYNGLIGFGYEDSQLGEKYICFDSNGIVNNANTDLTETKNILKEKMPILFDLMKAEKIEIPQRILEYFGKI